MKISVTVKVPDESSCYNCEVLNGDYWREIFGEYIDETTSKPCPTCISAREARNVKEGSK